MDKITRLISQILEQAGANEWPDVTNKVQRLFDHYSNLLHLSSNVGGWDGLAKLQEIADKQK